MMSRFASIYQIDSMMFLSLLRLHSPLLSLPLSLFVLSALLTKITHPKVFEKRIRPYAVSLR